MDESGDNRYGLGIIFWIAIFFVAASVIKAFQTTGTAK